MRQSGTGSGGGYGSKNVVHKPVRTGAGAKAGHLGGVSQLGNKVGDHLTNKTGGTGWRGDPLFAGPADPIRKSNRCKDSLRAGRFARGHAHRIAGRPWINKPGRSASFASRPHN